MSYASLALEAHIREEGWDLAILDDYLRDLDAGVELRIAAARFFREAVAAKAMTEETLETDLHDVFVAMLKLFADRGYVLDLNDETLAKLATDPGLQDMSAQKIAEALDPLLSEYTLEGDEG